MPYKINPITGQFDYYEAGANVMPFYGDSVLTSFQRSPKTTSSQNYGGGTSFAVGINVEKDTTIINAYLEITAVAVNPTPASFALYEVVDGVVGARLFEYSYAITTTGIYTIPVNLDLTAGIYAYATTQDIIAGYRCIDKTDNVFGIVSTMGANSFINSKLINVLTPLPNPYPVGQANDFTNPVPLVIFETQLL